MYYYATRGNKCFSRVAHFFFSTGGKKWICLTCFDSLCNHIRSFSFSYHHLLFAIRLKSNKAILDIFLNLQLTDKLYGQGWEKSFEELNKIDESKHIEWKDNKKNRLQMILDRVLFCGKLKSEPKIIREAVLISSYTIRLRIKLIVYKICTRVNNFSLNINDCRKF